MKDFIETMKQVAQEEFNCELIVSPRKPGDPMKREAVCPQCNGRQFVPQFSHDAKGECNGVSSVLCPTCGGMGSILVAARKGDALKTFTFAELAEFLERTGAFAPGTAFSWLMEPIGTEPEAATPMGLKLPDNNRR